MSAIKSINKFIKNVIFFCGIVSVSLIFSFVLDYIANTDSINIIFAKCFEFLAKFIH